MIWNYCLERASLITAWTWITLIVFGSTCFDIALQAKGSIAKLAIQELLKTIADINPRRWIQIRRQPEKIKRLSTEYAIADAYVNTLASRHLLCSRLSHRSPCALAERKQTQTEEEEWMQVDQELGPAHGLVN